MRNINDVTLVTIETHYHDLAARALEECTRRLPFRNVVTFSDRPIFPGAKNIPINNVPNIRDYCDIMLKSMWPFIETEQMLFVQWDAMVHDATLWTDEFLEYDYIGAVWPWEPPGQNVGCGGFSLRSRRLLHALRHPAINMSPDSKFGMTAEDAYIGVVHRNLLEQNGITFAPQEVAARFSYELGAYNGSMSFHGFWNIINFMPVETVNYFFENRPPNMFAGIHRAHHNIIALANRNRMDLFDTAIDDIRACSEFEKLVQWLGNEAFPCKDHVMGRLLSVA